ncbi:unnamed protein product [Prunus armeniaca]|uniref:Uncharacterized protein n=1 Tax=Prunus armeniaca TaxID=36596 RepID=A0A6J5Y9N6_PRUAR|nr:unnamed protein product [Prunus armeniaca]
MGSRSTAAESSLHPNIFGEAHFDVSSHAQGSWLNSFPNYELDVNCDKYDRNRCRRSEGKNLEKNEGEKGVYNLVLTSNGDGDIIVDFAAPVSLFLVGLAQASHQR